MSHQQHDADAPTPGPQPNILCYGSPYPPPQDGSTAQQRQQQQQEEEQFDQNVALPEQWLGQEPRSQQYGALPREWQGQPQPPQQQHYGQEDQQQQQPFSQPGSPPPQEWQGQQQPPPQQYYGQYMPQQQEFPRDQDPRAFQQMPHPDQQIPHGASEVSYGQDAAGLQGGVGGAGESTYGQEGDWTGRQPQYQHRPQEYDAPQEAAQPQEQYVQYQPQPQQQQYQPQPPQQPVPQSWTTQQQRGLDQAQTAAALREHQIRQAKARVKTALQQQEADQLEYAREQSQLGVEAEENALLRRAAELSMSDHSTDFAAIEQRELQKALALSKEGHDPQDDFERQVHLATLESLNHFADSLRRQYGQASAYRVERGDYASDYSQYSQTSSSRAPPPQQQQASPSQRPTQHHAAGPAPRSQTASVISQSTVHPHESVSQARFQPHHPHPSSSRQPSQPRPQPVPASFPIPNANPSPWSPRPQTPTPGLSPQAAAETRSAEDDSRARLHRQQWEALTPDERQEAASERWEGMSGEEKEAYMRRHLHPRMFPGGFPRESESSGGGSESGVASRVSEARSESTVRQGKGKGRV